MRPFLHLAGPSLKAKALPEPTPTQKFCSALNSKILFLNIATII